MQAQSQVRPAFQSGDSAVAASDLPSGPVMVVERWNSWVRVWSPETERNYWVDLEEVEYESADEVIAADDQPTGERPLVGIPATHR